MKIIQRYLGKTIISSTLSVLGVLLTLFAVIQLIAETRDIGQGHYTFLSAFYYVLLSLPSQFYNFAPIAFLLGTILGLSLLAKHSELTIIQSTGLALYQIAYNILKATLLIVILTVIIGEALAPKAANLAEKNKAFLTTSGQTLMTQQGSIWIRDGHNFLYIQSIINPQHLSQVSRYEFDDKNNLLKASFAKKLNYEADHWNAYQISTSDLSPHSITTKTIAEEHWPLSFSPKLLTISIITPAQMSLRQLHEYIRYRRNNLLNARPYELAFYQRLLQPLAIWVMMILAIPFTFKHTRNLAVSLRALAGVVVGFSFYLLNEFFGPFAIVYQWPPLLAAILPLLIFTIIALLLIYWAK